MDLKLMIEEAARRYGRKVALTHGEDRLSFIDLDEASNKVAHALLRIGVKKGDRVALLLSTSPAFVITYFGVSKSGAVAVPLDTNCKVAEISAFFDDCQPKVLIGESATLEPLASVLAKFKYLEHVIDVDTQGNGRFLSYQGILETSSAGRVETEIKPDDIALIVYASGSSRLPRGVVLTHRHLVDEGLILADAFQYRDTDIAILFALPLYHMFGLAAILLPAIFRGSTMVMVPGTGLSLNSLLAAVEREKGTVFMGVPYMFTLLVDMAEKEGIRHDLSSVRLWCSAGAPLSVDTVKRFKQAYGSDIVDAWGLTEAVCILTRLPLDGSGKPGSVGEVLPGWEVKVVDDNGAELPPNHTGEIITRGLLMNEYYHNPRATAELLRDGWLYTGDIGRLDEDNYLFITGRKKDMIILKGQNIYPIDIESALLAHPAVAEVAVLGIPDRLRGEVVGAVVSLKKGAVATEQELKRFCLQRIASYKVPRQVMFLNSLPRTADGKIDKESIRERLAIPRLFPGEAVPLAES